MNAYLSIQNALLRIKNPEIKDIRPIAIEVIDKFSLIDNSQIMEITNQFKSIAAEFAGESTERKNYANLINCFNYLFHERFDLLINSIIETQKLFIKSDDNIGLSAVMGLQATYYRIIGNYDLALETLMGSKEDLKIHEITKIRYLACLNDIAGINFDLKEYEEAFATYQEMELLAKKENAFYWITYALQGLGKIHQVRKNELEAKKYFNEALQISRENENKKSECNSLNAFASFYSSFGYYEKAIEVNKQSLEIRESLNLLSGAVTNYISLGEIYKKTGEIDHAIKILEKGLSLAIQINVNKKIYQIHQILSELFELKKDFSQSLIHFKNFHTIQLSIELEDNKRKLNNAKIIFESEQNRKENIIIKQQKKELEKEKEKSEYLLYNILPKEIAEELKLNGNVSAKLIDFTTIMFTDFKGFTQISERLSPKELVSEIDTCFKAFDKIISKYKIEKIKTIGDSYMCAGGLPIPNNSHSIDILNAAIEIQNFMETHKEERKKEGKDFFEIRIGIHTGPVVAGIVGLKKFAYDIWGDTVNIASRIESSGEVGKVNISQNTYELVKQQFKCTFRGKIEAKNKGLMEMYFVESAIIKE